MTLRLAEETNRPTRAGHDHLRGVGAGPGTDRQRALAGRQGVAIFLRALRCSRLKRDTKEEEVLESDRAGIGTEGSPRCDAHG